MGINPPMHGNSHSRCFTALGAMEDMLLAIHDRIACFPALALQYTPAGLTLVAPESCQMEFLCDLVERVEKLASQRPCLSEEEARGLRTTVEFLVGQLGRLDTGYITCPVCNHRLWTIRRSLDDFSARLDRCIDPPISLDVLYVFPPSALEDCAVFRPSALKDYIFPPSALEDQRSSILEFLTICVQDPAEFPTHQELTIDCCRLVADGHCAEWPQEPCANIVFGDPWFSQARERRSSARSIDHRQPVYRRDRPRIRGPDTSRTDSPKRPDPNGRCPPFALSSRRQPICRFSRPKRLVYATRSTT